MNDYAETVIALQMELKRAEKALALNRLDMAAPHLEQLVTLSLRLERYVKNIEEPTP